MNDRRETDLQSSYCLAVREGDVNADRRDGPEYKGWRVFQWEEEISWSLHNETGSVLRRGLV